MQKLNLKNKKVLLMGLGVLGGGVSTAKWLIKKDAKLTVTDFKTRDELQNSLKQLLGLKNKITFVLGEHRKKDFLENEIIVVNPDVPLSSPFLRLAIKNGKRIENELTLFYKSIPTGNIIAVTGTRGKTTTANWTYHLIKQKYPDAVIAGNSPDKPLLEEIKKVKKDAPVILETPSFLLEHVGNFRPRIAVITNIYRDHLNRYKDMKHYALTKSNIFRNQTNKDVLILNKNSSWTKLFLKQSAKRGTGSKVLFYRARSKMEDSDFTFCPSEDKRVEYPAAHSVAEESKDSSATSQLAARSIHFFSKRSDLKINIQEFTSKWGRHNLENLAAAVLAAKEFKLSEKQIIKAIKTLPQIKFRQELICRLQGIEIYNDTAATSPEATIAALERFGKEKGLILITGGTNRNLDFTKWAKTVKKYLSPENVAFLSGSATEKMKKELKWKVTNVFESLKDCLNFAFKTAVKKGGKILFSPSSKSFEKFKNEFDRGEQFNALVKKLIK